MSQENQGVTPTGSGQQASVPNAKGWRVHTKRGVFVVPADTYKQAGEYLIFSNILTPAKVVRDIPKGWFRPARQEVTEIERLQTVETIRLSLIERIQKWPPPASAMSAGTAETAQQAQGAARQRGAGTADAQPQAPHSSHPGQEENEGETR